MNLVYLANGDVIINDFNKIIEHMANIQSVATISLTELNKLSEDFNSKKTIAGIASSALIDSIANKNDAEASWNSAKENKKNKKTELDALNTDLNIFNTDLDTLYQLYGINQYREDIAQKNNNDDTGTKDADEIAVYGKKADYVDTGTKFADAIAVYGGKKADYVDTGTKGYTEIAQNFNSVNFRTGEVLPNYNSDKIGIGKLPIGKPMEIDIQKIMRQKNLVAN